MVHSHRARCVRCPVSGRGAARCRLSLRRARLGCDVDCACVNWWRITLRAVDAFGQRTMPPRSANDNFVTSRSMILERNVVAAIVQPHGLTCVPVGPPILYDEVREKARKEGNGIRARTCKLKEGLR